MTKVPGIHSIELYQHADFSTLLELERENFLLLQSFDFATYREIRLAQLQEIEKQYPENLAISTFIAFFTAFRPKIGIYAGSFNPFHLGHLNILEKAERIFDKVIIARGVNPEKIGTEADYDTLDIAAIQNRQREVFTGLLTDFLQSKRTFAEITLVKGLRNGDDLDYEVNQLRFMEDMFPEIRIVFIPCDKTYEHISSTSIRNLERIEKGLGNRYIPT